MKDNMCVKHTCHTEVCGFFFKFSNFLPGFEDQELFHNDFPAGFSEVDKTWTIGTLKNAEGSESQCG